MKKNNFLKFATYIITIPGLIVLGILLRGFQYGYYRPFWGDEMYLFEKISLMNWSNMFVYSLDEPLARLSAPPMFMIMSKLLMFFNLPIEYVQRFIPLVLGVVSIYLFYKLAIKLFDQCYAKIALGLFVLCPPLIYYSSEFKPYILDVFFTLILLNLFYYVLNGKYQKVASPLLFIGAISIWFSNAVVFVVATCGVFLTITFFNKRSQHHKKTIAFMCVTWLVSFGLNYVLISNELSKNSVMKKMWDNAYFPVPPDSLMDVLWLPFFVAKYFCFLLGLNKRFIVNELIPGKHVKIYEFFTSFEQLVPYIPIIVLFVFIVGAFIGLFVVGITHYIKTKKSLAFLLGFPLVLSFLASAMERFPFHQRFVLFYAPIVLICIVNGYKWSQASTRYRLTGNIAMGVVVLTMFLIAGYKVLYPPIDPRWIPG